MKRYYCEGEPQEAEMVQGDFGEWVKHEDAEKLQRENRQLEVAIYDIKTENNKLRRDKKRLDWILDEYYGCRFFDREEVDEAMKGEV